MADKDEGGWSKLLDRLQSPGDWVAACIGALGGAAVSLSVGGLDLGTSIATGAFAGVTAKATGEAALERRHLRKKAALFRGQIDEYLRKDTQAQKLREMLSRLEVQSHLWEDELIDNSKFAKLLGDLIEQFADEVVRAKHLLPLPNAQLLPPPDAQ
jgi:hypothetical protein